jgi:hypothetical protein
MIKVVPADKEDINTKEKEQHAEYDICKGSYHQT